ncbi:Yip1 family protein [Streptomyces sp. DSM 44915]|uniref:Yip1 family protein n=1 Tax=Streptomyces chisholmiae TaxID=3075540 RepID=A0ABU2K119_9ACTN|nr:Yip1 family protein [Streptomyces sp. DSM 44915]MDT0270143.1 Yip1 family protein [Streptomyces sp. DSM 44915]
MAGNRRKRDDQYPQGGSPYPHGPGPQPGYGDPTYPGNSPHPPGGYRHGDYGDGAHPDAGYGHDPHGGYPGDGYGDDGAPPPDDRPYGGPQPPPGPPRDPLSWRPLLTGIVLRPSDTFWTMRDYQMWWPALIVSFLYGLVAVFGLDDSRDTILETTISSLIPYLLFTGVAMVLGALVLSTVTHNLARQLGGNGLWAPTAGLAMLIMTLTDVPRLALALFLGGGHPVVQVLGWATWLYAGLLFSMMVSRSHEIAWPRALAASAIQLLGLLMLIKLGTL